MKKMTAVALASLVAISSIAGASRARVNGFGEAGTFIADVQNTFSIPTSLLSFTEAAYIEAGVGNAGNVLNGTENDIETNPWVGAHSSLFGGVVGLWVGRPVNEFDSLKSESSFASALLPWWSAVPGDFEGWLSIPYGGNPNMRNIDLMASAAPGSRVELMYGISLNDRIDLALSVNRAYFEFKEGQPGYHWGVINASQGISLGIGINHLGPLRRVDFGWVHQTQEFKIHENFTVFSVGTRADAVSNRFRMAGNLSDDSNTISALDATVNVGRMANKDKADGGAFIVAPEETVSSVDYSLGYALGRSSAKALGLGGLILFGKHSTVDTSLDSTNVNKQESSALRVDVVTGAEGKIKDWFSVRAGISGKAFGQATAGNYVALNSKTDTYKEYPADATVSTGMTFALGDVSIDTVFNRDFLYTGPYFLSSSGDNLLNTEVSATWNFGGGKE